MVSLSSNQVALEVLLRRARLALDAVVDVALGVVHQHQGRDLDYIFCISKISFVLVKS